MDHATRNKDSGPLEISANSADATHETYPNLSSITMTEACLAEQVTTIRASDSSVNTENDVFDVFVISGIGGGSSVLEGHPHPRIATENHTKG
jgi:hypothetical protein